MTATIQGTNPVDLSAGVVAVDCDLPTPSRHLSGADVRIEWRWLAAQRAVVGELWVGRDGEGLPGHVHGGLLAAVCDEAMGWACWMHGYAAPGAATAFAYRMPVQPGEALQLRAWLAGAAGRKLALHAEIKRMDAVAVAATGDYVAIRPKDLIPFAGWPGVDRFESAQWLARWPLRPK